MKQHRSLIAATAVIALLAVATSGFAATHDLALTMASNATQGRIPAGGITFTVTMKNNGPQKITYDEGLKIVVTKYDHTGQQYLKTVDTKEMPLLDPPGGGLVSDTRTFTDSSAAGTFFYKVGIKGTAYYTDSNNANNTAENSVIFYTPSTSPVKWSTRLTEADFTRAGATLTADQVSKLNSNTYTIESIVNSGTDRLVDGQRCNACHSGQATQSAAKYAPVTPIDKTRNHRINRTDANPTNGFTWANASASGVIGHFNLTSANKPAALRKIFTQWLLDGGQ